MSTSTTGSNYYLGFIGYTGATQYTNALYCYGRDSGTGSVIINNTTWDGTTNSGVFTSSLSYGKWYHFAIVLNGTTCIGYLNGIQFSTGSCLLTSIFGGGVANLGLGARQGQSAPIGETGSLSDVRIYNTALNSQQIYGIYASQGIPPFVSMTQSMPQPSLAWSLNGTITDSIQGLTFASPAQSYAPAIYGQGASFSNIVGYTSMTATLNTPISTSPGLTMSTWFKASAPSPPSNMVIMRLNSAVINPANSNQLGFGPIFTPTQALRFSYNDPVIGFDGITFLNPYVLNQWYHLCFVAKNLTYYIYVNGKLVLTQGYTLETIGSNAYTNFLLYNDSSPSGSQFILNDARIYTSALTAAQVQTIYTSSGIPASENISQTLPKPTLLWSFNGSNVDSVTGLSPTYSTITDGSQYITPSYVSGLYGQAAYFNNQVNYNYTTANSYIIYTTSSSLGITSNNSTYSLWIHPQYPGLPSLSSLRAGTNNILQIIDSATNYKLSTNGYGSPPGPQNGVVFSGGTNGNTAYSSTLQAYNTGKWCHLAVTLSNTGQPSGTTLSSFYFNGIFQGSNTHTIGTNGNVQSIWLAAQTNGGTQGVMGGFFYMQDLRIYNTALTAAQVQTIYTSSGIPASVTMTAG
jgi:hypothetical protein